jgi:hypothetical protein
MKNSAKIVRLALLAIVLGITLVGSAQPASAFSLNPGKLLKSAVKVAKSVVAAPVKLANNIAKGPVGKVAGQLGGAFSTAFKVGSQLALASGKGLVSGGALFGSNLIKIATSKDPLGAALKVAVLGTPLAPFALAAPNFNPKQPPRLKDLVPAPPTLAGLSRGNPFARLSSPNSVFAGPKSTVIARFDPKRPLVEVRRTMLEPARKFEEAKRTMEAPKQKAEEVKRILEEPLRKPQEAKRTIEEPKRNELKRTPEESKLRKFEEVKRTEEPKQRKLEEVKRTEDAKHNELKKMTAEPKAALGAPKPMMATPKPMMTPTPPPAMGGYGGGIRH